MRTKKRGASVYQVLGAQIEKRRRQKFRTQHISLAPLIRKLRIEKGLKGVELCRRAGNLDPRLLTAIEKGRVKNPSIKTLEALSRGLGVLVGDLFRQAELEIDRHFYTGTQKGAFQMDFPWAGVKAVSLTPFNRNFFLGKLILSARRRIDQTFLKQPLPLYISALVGQFEITIEDRKVLLKEGGNIFFNGILKHSFYNPLQRESVFLMVTAPSFL